MDPDKAWADAQDESLSDDERLDAIDALFHWFGTGGFAPANYTDEGWKALKGMWLAAQSSPTGDGEG